MRIGAGFRISVVAVLLAATAFAFPALAAAPVTNVADRTVVPDGWYIAGSFTHVGGLARRDLAHIRANGTVDPAFDATFDPAPTANIRALARSGSTLFVGGSFSSIGGKTRNALAALDGSTGKATSWDAGANNASGSPRVEALTVSGSTLFVGGIFTGIGGESAGNVAALDVSTGGWLWAGFADSTVQSLAVSGSNVYLLGGFQNVNGQARHHLD